MLDARVASLDQYAHYRLEDCKVCLGLKVRNAKAVTTVRGERERERSNRTIQRLFRAK